MPEEICGLRQTISVDPVWASQNGDEIGVMSELGADCSALSCGSQELPECLVLTTQSLVLTQYLAVTVAVKTQISVDDPKMG